MEMYDYQKAIKDKHVMMRKRTKAKDGDEKVIKGKV
jgi:hypothetical protein